jgi:anaerobic selenocysteine-containing dehydrogenase/Fe-S-cluster-containing dehydrogenase component
MAKKQKKHYGMLINLNKCIGCYACQVTCKAEYNLPYGIFRCKIETYQLGKYPDLRKFFLPRLCNHCDNAPCIEACEEGALFKNSDGIVVLNRDNCTGCQKCYEKCPYNAIEINPYTEQAEKCDFCYSKIQKGEPPVCVKSCMGKAIVFGDIRNKKTEISIALRKNQIKALNPEFGTNPSVFYVFKGNYNNIPLKNYEINLKHSLSKRLQKSKSLTKSNDSAIKLIYTSDVMCPSECGISVLVENGVAKKIYGNPHSLINNGTFCAKGASGLQLTYSPHRIKTPLMRTGQRGEDKWKEITWQEASDYIAKKLIEIKQKYGPEAVFLDCGDVTDREAYYRLFHAFGTPNTYNHGSVCDPNRKWGQWIMMGDERPLPDIQRPILIRNEYNELYLNKKHDARLILNIGVNPFVATRFNYMSNGIPQAKEENNCIYIVVDPAFTNSASMADIWLPIIPGSDPALLAAMLYYIIKNDSKHDPSKRYIDNEFLKKYTIGWQEFKKAFLAYTEKKDPSNNLFYFTPEWAEEKTGISKKDIERISHLFGITKPATIEIGMHGTAHHTNGDVTSILMTALCLITGNIDTPGGLVFIDSQKPKKGIKTDGKRFLEKIVKREINGREISGRLSELNKDLFGDYPAAWKGVLADLPRKIREGIKLKHGPFKGYSYPVKAFITRAGNPIISAGSTPDWIDALTAKDASGNYLLELMVFIDTHITVTGRYADIVLPEAGFLERMGVSDVYTMSPEVALRDKVIKPLYESKTPFEIMITLSEALIRNGDPDIKAEDFSKKYKNEEDFINEVLSETPGFYNIGEPLPYPDLPEGSLIIGVPDNPRAIWGTKVIKEGELLTVDWLRRHHGVAIWPTSYYRYKKSDGFLSGIYPKTGSKKFEFKFSYLEEINKKFGTDFPATFYWHECKWNPKNPLYKDISKEYPFQLISGRVHHAMTMTVICPYLAETETECMKPLNDDFQYLMPELKNIPKEYSIPENKKTHFKAGSVSIPILAFNKADGERLGIKTGDLVTLENPLKKRVRGKVFLTDEIMPGVIKTAFGPGGQRASGIGFMNNTSEYTPNINELFDPENITPFTGMPGFGDIMVKVIKG